MSTEPRLSGAILTDQLAVMRNRFGAPLVDRAVESLSFEDQHEVRSLTSIGWTTAALACRLKTAVAQEAKMEPLELQRWVVQEGERKTGKRDPRSDRDRQELPVHSAQQFRLRQTR